MKAYFNYYRSRQAIAIPQIIIKNSNRNKYETTIHLTECSCSPHVNDYNTPAKSRGQPFPDYTVNNDRSNHVEIKIAKRKYFSIILNTSFTKHTGTKNFMNKSYLFMKNKILKIRITGKQRAPRVQYTGSQRQHWNSCNFLHTWN